MSPPSLFADPRSKPAQRLHELAARRRELVTRERDALTALQTARAEHTRLERVIADDEAKALAHNESPAVPKAAQGKVDRLAQQVAEHTHTSDLLSRAILTIDEEAREVTRVNVDELLNEAIGLHDHARERITELATELRAQQAALTEAYASAQRILATAGRNQLTARLRVTPTVEQLVREGSAPPLIHEDDRAIAA